MTRTIAYISRLTLTLVFVGTSVLTMWPTQSIGEETPYYSYYKWVGDTLYLVVAKKNYQVAFYANGGKGTMAAQKMTYGKAKKLRTNKFTRTGYKFIGWAKSKALAKKGRVAYRNKQSVKNLVTTGKTVKLYAVWVPVVTIKFNANGGRVAKKKLLCSTYLSSGAYYLNTSGIPTPSRNGYDFVDWYTKKSGGTPLWRITVKKPKKMTLYAHWALQTPDDDYSGGSYGGYSGGSYGGYSGGSYGGYSGGSYAQPTKTIEFYLDGDLWKTMEYTMGEPFCTLPTAGLDTAISQKYGENTSWVHEGWFTAEGNGNGYEITPDMVVGSNTPSQLYAHGKRKTVFPNAGVDVGGRGTMR